MSEYKLDTYEDVVSYILKIPFFAKKIGQENLTSLLCRLGNPQDGPHIIHVAGTNGKGSFCRALSYILRQEGYKVGLFTSPHLVSINERIQINGENISDADFVDAFKTVKKEFDVHPSFFEVVYAMAAVYFKKQKVDYVIYETGMGGRLDATNVVKPDLTVITSVAMDHMEYLGDTLEKIAGEKAGIIKSGIPVLYFKRDEIASSVIEEKAQAMSSKVYKLTNESYNINSLDDKNIDFSLHTRYYNYDHLAIPKTSLYQVENCSLAAYAYCILKGDSVREEVIRKGLMAFEHPGRMEQISDGIYVDGAHNEEAIESYVKTLKELYNDKEKILVFAAVKDKNYASMIHLLTKDTQFSHIIVTSVHSDRRADLNQLGNIFETETDKIVDREDSIDSAMRLALKYKKELSGSAVFCVGSLYLVGEIKSWLKSRHGGLYD